MDHDDNTNEVRARDGIRGIGRLIRLLVAAALVAAVVIVAFDNTDDVRLGYAVGDANGPIWIVVVAAALAGAVISWLVRHRSRNV